MKKKMGWKVYGIIGFVFAPMGALFLLLGLVMGNTSAVSWQYNNDQAVFLAVFGGLGGLFLITGLVFLGIDIRRRMLLRRAYNEGNCVESEFLGITELRNVNMVQGRPRMAECAWTDGNGVVHVYRSRYLYTDVTRLLQGKKIPVYVDRYNENIGFVDIDAVLPEIRIHG